MFTNFFFSEILLVAAANSFKVFKIFISLKVTAYIQDRRLRSEKALMSRVWNGNLIVLKWQNKHIISNIKWRETEKEKERDKERESEREREREREKAKLKTSPSSLLYIQQRRIQNPFQHVSKEGISSLEVTIFTKISILDV